MNIYDIAKQAGVSTATVSRVINGSKNVSEKTLAKVKQVMEELHYTPSQIAVGLATSNTKTIGIMIPDIRNGFHAETAYLLESKMMKRGYNCILCNTGNQNKQKADYLNTLYSKNVDGIILVGASYQDKKIDEAQSHWKKKMPMVLINSVSGEGTASVLCDEKYGICKALEYLKEKGKQYPIFIKDKQDSESRTSLRKEQGYIAGMQEIYSGCNSLSCYTSAANVEAYVEFLRQQKQEKNGMDAVLFTSDICAALFLKAMEQVNLQAPEDIALIGFNNDIITELTTPRLTTIDHEIEKHCALAVEKLFDLIQGKEVEKLTTIRPRLVIKET